MKSIAIVFGTRPEIIKLAPVYHELKNSKTFKIILICTGQHQELLIPLIDYFRLRVNHRINLEREGQDLNDLLSKLISKLGQYFYSHKVDLIIGQGDTTSVLAAALCAFQVNIPFAHIEAGLRSNNIRSPFPEEMNRVLVSKLSTYHFCPTKSAASNLINEGINSKNIHVVGNTVIDALKLCSSSIGASNISTAQKKILVTIHRRENHGKRLNTICDALKIIAKNNDVELIIPVHPNPNVKKIIFQKLGKYKNIKLLGSLNYLDLVSLLMQCYFVITDSGGLQEEAPFLGKPLIVLRDETERPEIVRLGGAKLVGANTNVIVAAAEKLLYSHKNYEKMVLGYSPYGDGDSSKKICKILYKNL